MNDEQAAALRAAFDPKQIGKLPKPKTKDAQKGKCPECGGWHGLPAVHLDYVGHAATTDRLLQVDPEWTWEPLALTPEGLPALDRAGNLWIKLTIAGVTRLGVGDGSNAKECIGDAIRNAAMRFGVALDLWAKEDLSHDESRPSSLSSSGAPVGNGGEGAAADAGTSAAAAAEPKSPFAQPKPKEQPAATGESQTELTRLLTVLVDAKKITPQQFTSACRNAGAKSEDPLSAITQLSEPAAKNLIERLAKLEARKAAA